MDKEIKNDLEPEWRTRTELSLNNLRKWDLIRYIKRLEGIISKYESLLAKEKANKDEAVAYINKHTYNERTQRHIYDLTNRETKELLKILTR